VAVDSYISTYLAEAMVISLLDSVSLSSRDHPLAEYIEPSEGTTASILGLGNDIQAILGEAMATATAMFPHRPPSVPDRSYPPPRHLWPKSVRHDIYNTRRRTKVNRRYIRLEVRPHAASQKEPSHLDTPLSLWSCVNTPLPLRTILSPPL
jgi:hypothetical protein